MANDDDKKKPVTRKDGTPADTPRFKVADPADLPAMFARAAANNPLTARGHDHIARNMRAMHDMVNADPALRAEFDVFSRQRGCAHQTPQTLPAVVTRSLVPFEGALPLFVRVSDLPAFGAPVVNFVSKKTWDMFAPGVDRSEIVTLSDMLHGDAVMDAVFDGIAQKARLVDEGQISHNGQLPEAYRARYAVYEIDGARIKLMEDALGRYMYAWPHDNAAGRVEQAPQPRKLAR